GQQLRVFGGKATIAADVEDPTLFGGDDADVLGPRLGALPRATRNAQFDFVRGPQPPVAQLQVDGHLHRILYAVATPVVAHAALHRVYRLAVGVAAVHAGLDQPFSDQWQLLDVRVDHVDPLTAGDLGVEPEFLRNLTDQDQVLGLDVAAGHPGHHRVAAV